MRVNNNTDIVNLDDCYEVLEDTHKKHFLYDISRQYEYSLAYIP